MLRAAVRELVADLRLLDLDEERDFDLSLKRRTCEVERSAHAWLGGERALPVWELVADLPLWFSSRSLLKASGLLEWGARPRLGVRPLLGPLLGVPPVSLLGSLPSCVVCRRANSVLLNSCHRQGKSQS